MAERPAQYRPQGSRTTKERMQTYNKRRGSPTARGYGSRWQKYAKWFLKQEENIMCTGEGCDQVSTEVDHIKPVSGPNDPLFWDTSNHEGMCKRCHSTKTGREGGRR